MQIQLKRGNACLILYQARMWNVIGHGNDKRSWLAYCSLGKGGKGNHFSESDVSIGLETSDFLLQYF